MITRKMTEDELAGKVICVNCKYCWRNEDLADYYCKHFTESYPDYVTGEIEEEEISSKNVCSEINHAGECAFYLPKIQRPKS